VTLARRLARLEGLTAARPSALASSPEPMRSPARTEVASKLDELRRELEGLLARSERRRPAPAAPVHRRRSFEQLPFTRRETAAGALWQRLEPLAPDQRVGQVAIEQLLRAQPGVLAELALDASVADSSPTSWLFLDTETTGLSGAGTLAFLIGMAGVNEQGGLELEQLLLPEPDRERSLLLRVLERFQAASLIISFNGKSFDRPLLEGRLVMNRLPPLPERPHLDLLHVARRLHRERLGRCSLKRLESQVLGFERGPDIDGSEVAGSPTWSPTTSGTWSRCWRWWLCTASVRRRSWAPI
jgi:hypothetical protein